MQYFIPAWYNGNDWKENEQVWYRSRAVTEFDDTVKQIQLFFRNHVAPFHILVLGFSPNFRHFLHRQGVYHASYASIFDMMQGVSEDSMKLFSYKDLEWPDGVEFIYSPFTIVVMHNGVQYAQIEFAEDGNMFRVDMFEKGQMHCRNYYDDRGFVSCQVIYQDGQPYWERYFNEDGVWKFARSLEDEHVIINPESNFYILQANEKRRKVTYQKERYNKIDEVIEEVLQEFLMETQENDKFIVAMHSLHSGVLGHVMKERKTIMSLFERRFADKGMTDADIDLLLSADYIVADKQVTADSIQQYAKKNNIPMRVITPYDSRVEFSSGQHLRVQNVFVPVDRIRDDIFDKMIVELANYVKERNDRARINLIIQSLRYNEKRNMINKVRTALFNAGLDPDYAREESGVSENLVDESDKADIIFSVIQCLDEMSVSKELQKQRVMVDLREVPEQFIQISAMSMGIPQVTMKETDYLVDGKNGIVVHEISQLSDAIEYYLSDIAHFNEAQIASYDLGSNFTTDKLVNAWKEVMAE